MGSETTQAAAEEWPPGMKIVNGHQAHSIREQGMIQPPNGYGYIHLAAEVERPGLFRKSSPAKRELLARIKTAAASLKAAHPDQVRRVDVFDAAIIPPGSKEGRRVIDKFGYDVHIAAFDTVVLVECVDPPAAKAVRDGAAFSALQDLLKTASSYVRSFVGHNAKRIAEVDRDRDGIFLFNYFYAPDIAEKGAEGVETLLGVWEYTAGWWTAKTGLTNSTPMRPEDGESYEYSLVNHCRWDRLIDVLPHLIFRPTLGSFVLKNFTANDIMAMPILYRLVR